MNRRRFLRHLGLGGLVAWFSAAMPAVASTVESAVQALSDIRDIALGPGNPNQKLDAIVAIIDGEIGPLQPSIEGDFAGTIPAGETWRITGDVNLTGDLIVEGTLTGVDTFTIEGNGHQILVQNGGRLDLAGKAKTAWVSWGDAVTGWNTGDRLAVAPMSVGEFDPTLATWQGSWAATFRPAISPDVTLSDGRVMRPEVANLDRSIVFRNLSRVMFHHGAGSQAVRHLSVVDSGVTDTLDFYPLHFHLNGDTTRGSVFDSVVVEGGRNHAFVPHGSHGITTRDCVAFDIAGDAWWWNVPSSATYTPADDSEDLNFDRSLALKVDDGFGFRLAGGEGGRMVGCVASATGFGRDKGGVHWRHGTDVWEFSDFVTHNNRPFGVTVWQNQSSEKHLIDRAVSFHNDLGDFDHGAYGNLYHYRDIIGGLFVMHAKSEEGDGLFLTLERAVLDELKVVKHALGRWKEAKVIDSTIGVVRYAEKTGKPSWMQYIGCGLTPADFIIEAIQPGSVIEIIEGGSVVHRFEANAWVS